MRPNSKRSKPDQTAPDSKTDLVLNELVRLLARQAARQFILSQPKASSNGNEE